MEKTESTASSSVALLRTIAMGSAIAMIIGGLSLLGFDLYRNLIEQTETAQKNLERAFKETQRQTFVYSSMLL